MTRVASETHTSDSDILRFADAGSGGGRVEFIDTFARNNLTFLSVLVVSFISQTFRADTLNNVVARGTHTFARVEVVDLIGTTFDSADTFVDVIELSVGALSAEVVDQVETWLADTSIQDPIFID